jgi:hypothetical protein
MHFTFVIQRPYVTFSEAHILDVLIEHYQTLSCIWFAFIFCIRVNFLDWPYVQFAV